jgi:hypothetical protein
MMVPPFSLLIVEYDIILQRVEKNVKSMRREVTENSKFAKVGIWGIAKCGDLWYNKNNPGNAGILLSGA